MAQIMINCPKTGRPLPIGIGATQESFKAVSFSGMGVDCPHCGAIHEYSTEDTFLEE